ncbi:MAG TPA: hypothetical protein VFE96_02225 [Candidatus Bathyarchaeia archaeon]|nr:hypothetical protein [Candidatus Bathyarchaeia archaeon]
MAKRLILYMSREDEDQFLQYVRSLGSVVILPATSPSSDFAPIVNLPEPSQDEASRRFWLQFAGAAMPLITEYTPEGDQYVVDGFQSPVIEFWRSWKVSQIIVPGGIQVDLMWFDGDKKDLDNKPIEFRDWFESIDHWIKRNYRRLGVHIFAGPGAQKFAEEGGILQGR